jgi:hypothetical protein
MRRALLVAALLTSALLVAACQKEHRAAGEAATPVTPPISINPIPGVTAELRVRDDAGRAGPFKLGDLDSLAVEVNVSGAVGVHEARVDVVTPRGTLYAQLPATVEIGEAGAASSTAVVHVRGTFIESYRQTGTWQFRAYVDGVAAAASDVEVTE